MNTYEAVPAVIVPDRETPILDAARMYLDLGLLPIPVYGVRDGGACQCGNRECKAPGKHPIGTNWQKRAPRTLDDARDLFEGHHGNIGVCVAGTPFVCLDYDGEEGLRVLNELDNDNLIPRTLRARTGGGGAHLIYELDQWHDAAAISDRRIMRAWDVKKHGQFLGAPSRHASGAYYEWIDRVPIAKLTDPLFDRIRKPVYAVPSPSSAPAGSAVTRARAYVAAMPPAISGSGGHNATFAVARKLVHGFGLSEGDAWTLLLEYNQRCEPPWSERELRHKFDDAGRANLRDPVPSRDLPPRESESPPPARSSDRRMVAAVPDWKANLIWTESRTGKQKLVSHVENVMVILSTSPEWTGRIRYDEFRGRIVLRDPPWSEWHRPHAAESSWTDEDATRMNAWLRREWHAYAFSPTITDVERGVEIVARANGYHPVHQYLDALEWDGTPRLRAMATTYFGAASSPYAESVARWWMTSAVARIKNPGCKADHVLILEGRQGRGKSTALEILAGAEWFSDSAIDLNSKDAFERVRGRWIVELAELDALFRVESSRAKQFFSSKRDDYRPAYARREREQLRQCVFAGTVNEGVYLKDPSGARRFWPILCQRLDLDALRRDRDQLWAEAVSCFVDGHRWWPEGDEARLLEEEQESRTEHDEWRDRIERYLAKTNAKEIPAAELLEFALGLEPRDWTRANQTRLGVIMQHGLRWPKRRQRVGAVIRWVYERRSNLDDVIQPREANSQRLDQKNGSNDDVLRSLIQPIQPGQGGLQDPGGSSDVSPES